MTLPDDLTKPVAAALRQLDAERRWSRSRAGYEVDAEAIVAALLRALPESKDSRLAIATALDELLDPEECVDATFIALAAIAKLAD